MNITVIFPTQDETRFFKRDDVNVCLCGVGLIAATFGTYKAILETKPDIVIMGGIAGVYETSKYKVGDVVLISEERIADIGFFYPEGFRHLADMSLDMSFELYSEIKSPIEQDFGLEKAVSNTMNCAMAPFAATEGVDVENMEGGSFFYVCQKLGIPFLEVRSISNVVDLNREEWDYEGSIKILAEGLNKVIDTLLKR